MKAFCEITTKKKPILRCTDLYLPLHLHPFATNLILYLVLQYLLIWDFKCQFDMRKLYIALVRLLLLNTFISTLHQVSNCLKHYFPIPKNYDLIYPSVLTNDGSLLKDQPSLLSLSYRHHERTDLAYNWSPLISLSGGNSYYCQYVTAHLTTQASWKLTTSHYLFFKKKIPMLRPLSENKNNLGRLHWVNVPLPLDFYINSCHVHFT